MPLHPSPLEEAFIEDHRCLTQGFSELLDALQGNDLAAAASIADEIDRKAGPHIEFEEEVMYPEVKRSRGAVYADRLFQEHKTAFDAIRFLLDQAGAGRLEEADRQRLIQQAETGLEHAISCGTLLSYLSVLDSDVQTRLLEQLNEFRRAGHRWTEYERVPKIG